MSDLKTFHLPQVPKSHPGVLTSEQLQTERKRTRATPEIEKYENIDWKTHINRWLDEVHDANQQKSAHRLTYDGNRDRSRRFNQLVNRGRQGFQDSIRSQF